MCNTPADLDFCLQSAWPTPCASIRNFFIMGTSSRAEMKSEILGFLKMLITVRLALFNWPTYSVGIKKLLFPSAAEFLSKGVIGTY